MLIYLITVIAVNFILQSIVIVGRLYTFMAGSCAQLPLVASGIILPAGPARETIFPALLPAVTHANLGFSVRTFIGMHV